MAFIGDMKNQSHGLPGGLFEARGRGGFFPLCLAFLSLACWPGAAARGSSSSPAAVRSGVPDDPGAVDLFNLIRTTPKDDLNRELQRAVKVRTSIRKGPFLAFYPLAREVNRDGVSRSIDGIVLVKTGPDRVRLNGTSGNWIGTCYIGKDKNGRSDPARRDPIYSYFKAKRGTVRIVYDLDAENLIISPEFTSGGEGIVHAYVVDNEGVVQTTTCRTVGVETKIEAFDAVVRRKGQTCEVSETRLFGIPIQKSIQCDEGTDSR
jgi:hypothetical protein